MVASRCWAYTLCGGSNGLAFPSIRIVQSSIAGALTYIYWREDEYKYSDDARTRGDDVSNHSEGNSSDGTDRIRCSRGWRNYLCTGYHYFGRSLAV